MDLCLQAGKYVWKTYKEVYDLVIKVVNAIRTCGVEEVSFLVLLEDYLILFISIFALTYYFWWFIERKMWYLRCQLPRVDYRHGGEWICSFSVWVVNLVYCLVQIWVLESHWYYFDSKIDAGLQCSWPPLCPSVRHFR